MFASPGEAAVVMIVKDARDAWPLFQHSHRAANDSGDPSARAKK